MYSLPAHHPAVPFSSHIIGGIHSGSRLVIRGVMQPGADRFTIDLQCGPIWGQDDSAFHISVRPQQGAIVRNTFEYKNWGPEERSGGCPIVPGHAYDIEITADFQKFTVRVNGRHFCTYNHRMQMDRISHILISGDTTLHYVGH